MPMFVSMLRLAPFSIVLAILGGAVLYFRGHFKATERAVRAAVAPLAQRDGVTLPATAVPTRSRAQLADWVRGWWKADMTAHARADSMLLGDLETGPLLVISETTAAADSFRRGGTPAATGSLPALSLAVSVLPPRDPSGPFLAQVAAPVSAYGPASRTLYVFLPGESGSYRAALAASGPDVPAPLPLAVDRDGKASAVPARRAGTPAAHAQLASYFAAALRSGRVPVGRFVPGPATTGVARGFARGGPLFIDPRTHVRRTLRIGKGATVAAFAYGGGRRLECGTVALRLSYRPRHGSIVQGVDRGAFGPAVAPGRYAAVEMRSLFSSCIALGRGDGQLARVFGTGAGLAEVTVRTAR
jgi:hypothetical protein